MNENVVVQGSVPTLVNWGDVRLPVCSVKRPVVVHKAGTMNGSSRICPVVRKAVTKEGLAVRIGQGWASDAEKTIFHDLIVNLIKKRVSKYYATSRDDFEDLVNDCWVKIFRYIKTYNPSKSKVSTWVWWVCRSVLNQDYGYSQRWKENHIFGKAMMRGVSPDTVDTTTFRMDFESLVAELFENHPEHVDILGEMFVNEEGRVACPGRLSLAGVARRANRSYSEVYKFVDRYVRPVVGRTFIVNQ